MANGTKPERTAERRVVAGSSSGRSQLKGAVKRAFNSPDLAPPALQKIAWASRPPARRKKNTRLFSRKSLKKLFE